MKLLFVCYGNICRSPMAEYIMRSLVEKAGLSDKIEAESAATSTEELGNPIYMPARRELERHGILCGTRSARQMTKADYRKFDLLVGMERRNTEDMRRICGGDPGEKIFRLLDFTEYPGDIADPWYSGDFAAAWKDIYAGCEALLRKIKNEQGNEGLL